MLLHEGRRHTSRKRFAMPGRSFLELKRRSLFLSLAARVCNMYALVSPQSVQSYLSLIRLL